MRQPSCRADGSRPDSYHAVARWYDITVSWAILRYAAAHARRHPSLHLVRGGMPLPFASRSFDAAILSLVLHESDEEPEILLREALRVAPVCFVLEWRMPERNLDLPGHALTHAIERLAGKRHYARYRAFVRGGGLHGAAFRAKARVVHEEALMGGTMVLAELGSRLRCIDNVSDHTYIM